MKNPALACLLAFLAGPALSLQGADTQTPPSPERPNFLFIAVDDLNNYTSFLLEQDGHFLSKLYPDPEKRREMARRLTPNLDRLARESLVFDRAFCPQALCGPSRTALLTGIPPHISGYYNHSQHFRYNPVLQDVVTLPQYLKANGYQTIGLGKVFHKAGPEKKDDGRIHDWADEAWSWSTWIDRFIGMGGKAQREVSLSPYSPADGLFRFGNSTLPAESSWDYLNAEFAARLYSEGSADIFDRNGVYRHVELPGEQPFFLACGLFAPHLPWFPPQEFYDRFPVEEIQFDEELVTWLRADKEDLPKMALERFIGNDFDTLYAIGQSVDAGPHGLRAAVQAYLASVAYADYCLGQLVDAIDQSPRRDNTVIILWSDHGWHLGDKYRFRKHALWEPATHNILLVRDPAIPATMKGIHTNEVVGLQDLYPTIVRRAGLEMPPHVWGHDLAPLLKDPDTVWDKPVLMTYGEGNHSLRTNRWRYIRYRDGGKELYDMQADPFEYTNLAGKPEYKSIEHEMDIRLESKLATGEARLPDPNPNPGNPIVETIWSADPDVHVWDETVWMYTSQDHDPDEGERGYENMDGYHAFSSTDLEHWTDHGEIFHSRDVDWGIGGGGWMWAPGVARKDGTYYLYYPHKNREGKWRIGVATSDHPAGPFKDSGHFIEGTHGIDPMCFIDEDGEAYLYFAHEVARLKPNMVELAEEPRRIDYGANDRKETSEDMVEAPWMYQRDGVYYFSYSNYRNKEYQGFYGMGSSPYGPFEWKGPVNPAPPGAQDHHSIVQFKDQWYYFYHVGNFTRADGLQGRGNRRSVCVDRLYHNPDGTMRLVEQTEQGVSGEY